MLARFFAFAVVATCVSSVASAGVISANDPLFGVGALTRDTGQGLDFLDLTLSTNRSFNDVSSQFGAGGDFAGFRYATEAEVIALINNWGFSPGAVAGQSTLGDTGGDQLSGLVDLLGATRTFGGTFPSNDSLGLTGTFVGPPVRFVFIRDNASVTVGHNLNDAVTSNLTFDPTTSASETGSFLVQASVPEPASITLFGLGAGMVGIGRWRRRRK